MEVQLVTVVLWSLYLCAIETGHCIKASNAIDKGSVPNDG